jgi:tetratricopeptide (TPR) repeat protein
LKLLERPENNIQSGNVMDILLHHAVAELQDAAGLIEDRNKTTAAALAIQPAPMQTTELLVPISLYDQCEMIEHFYVGWTLSHRYRLHGAIAHYQKVMEAGHIDLRLPASEDIAKIYASYLVDYPSALIWIDKHLTILEKEYKGSDAKARIALIQKRKTYYLAEQAAAEGNWTDVWLLLAKVWSMPNTPGVQEFAEDVDSLILAHHVCKQQSILAAGFADTMEAHRKTIWNRLETDYNRTPRESQPEKMVQMCNRAAWLLANMDGDYRSALILAEAALKDEPDDVGVLDTLAHVYFLGGKVDEAIRTQEQVVRLVPEVVRFRQALERFKDAKEKIIE